jgi:PII-like signaling protein
MLNAGKAVKVSIYLSEGSKHHGVPTYSSILDFLFYRGVSGATVLKGIAGPHALRQHCRDLRPSSAED